MRRSFFRSGVELFTTVGTSGCTSGNGHLLVNPTMASGVLEQLTSECSLVGMQCSPFKIGWYNELVEPAFEFPQSGETLAVNFLSVPSTFELLFLPYIARTSLKELKIDPLDQCMREWLEHVKHTCFPHLDIDIIQDYELHPNHRPKVLAQTSGHASGQAYLYQRSDVVGDPWGAEKKIYPVSVHGKFGGWFGFRGVMIFKSILALELVKKAPVDCVFSREKRIELLDKYNFHWRDGSYRDVSDCQIIDRYSEKQTLYFDTEPAKRIDLITQWKSE